MITIQLEGTEQLERRLASLGPHAVPVLAQAMYQDGEQIMAISKEQYVPVDFGVLRASGYVEQPEIAAPEIRVTLGYGGAARDYALVTHENPRAGKTGGVSPRGRLYEHWAKVGEWKYLETPFKAASAGMLDRWGAFLNQAITELGRS